MTWPDRDKVLSKKKIICSLGLPVDYTNEEADFKQIRFSWPANRLTWASKVNIMAADPAKPVKKWGEEN